MDKIIALANIIISLSLFQNFNLPSCQTHNIKEREYFEGKLGKGICWGLWLRFNNNLEIGNKIYPNSSLSNLSIKLEKPK